MSALALNVVWHNNYAAGRSIAEALAAHFEGAEDQIGSAGLSIPVRIRCEGRDPADPQSPPIDIPFDEDTVNIVVLLAEGDLIRALGGAWSGFATAIRDELKAHPERMLVLPVQVGDQSRVPPFDNIQSLATSVFPGAGPSDLRWMRRLTLTIVAHLGNFLRRIERSAANPRVPVNAPLLSRFQLFLSHAKRDGVGVVNAIRDHLANNNYGVETFIDAKDLNAGLDYQATFTAAIEAGAVVVIRSDAYSSRPWCRWETLEGKRLGRPIVVLDLLNDAELRVNPYGGNVPALRLPDLLQPGDAATPDIDRAVLAIMTEAVRIMVWNMRVGALTAPVGQRCPDRAIRVLPRPPELVDIANLRLEDGTGKIAVVHPGPPLTQAEDALIKAIAGDLVLFAPSDLGVVL